MKGLITLLAVLAFALAVYHLQTTDVIISLKAPSLTEVLAITGFSVGMASIAMLLVWRDTIKKGPFRKAIRPGDKVRVDGCGECIISSIDGDDVTVTHVVKRYSIHPVKS